MRKWKQIQSCWRVFLKCWVMLSLSVWTFHLRSSLLAAQTSDNSHKDSRSVHPNTVRNREEVVATKESPKRWVNLFPNDHMGFSSYNPILVLLRAGSKSPALEPHESCDCSSQSREQRDTLIPRPGFTSPSPTPPHVFWEPLLCGSWVTRRGPR